MIKLFKSLRARLTISYILIVLIVIVGIRLVSYTFINKIFIDYVIHKQEKQTNNLIHSIEAKYVKDMKFDMNYLDIVGMDALENGMIIELFDTDNNTVWSAYKHNNGMCQSMLADMKANMFHYNGKWEGSFEEKSYPIIVNNNKVGIITTGFIGPYYINDQDLELVKTLNRLFIITSICLLVIAFVLGIAMSLRITNPLKRISKKASLLSEGNYKQRLDDDSNMSEISILTQTINNLSDALERKEQVRKQLTQDVAHELRTPITSVQGHLEAMIDGIWPMNKERLSSCYEEIIRIKRLIGTIDDINGLENETILIHKAEFDLSRLINRILSNYEKEILTKSIKLSYQAQKIIMNADEDKISQVFHNLISNAIKYSNDGDELTIETVDRPKQVEIKVIDTGIGMDKSDLEHIFERFYRADKSRNRKTGGMGVGLTITKKIIEAHGGTITAISQIGAGTEFTIILPK